MNLLRSFNARQPNVHKQKHQTDTQHYYDNVINRDFTAAHLNQKWVTDITYVRTDQGWAYLSTIQVCLIALLLLMR